MTPPFFGSNIMKLLVFSILSRKSVSGSRLHGVCMGRSGTSSDAVYALFSHFCYVGGFGDLGEPMRGVSGDVVRLYAYQDTKGGFLQSLALLGGVHNPCQKCEMTVSTNNDLRECTGRCTTCLCSFSP